MAFIEIIRKLWHRKLLVTGVIILAVAAATFSSYRVSSSGLEKRALSISAASGQILVDNADTLNSTKGVEAGAFEALVTRAQIYAQYLAGLDARQEIAKIADVPVNSLSTSGPFSGAGANPGYASQTSEERTGELLKEGDGNRLNFLAQEDVPIITVTSQAATTGTAVALAKASFTTLQRYIARLSNGDQPDKGAVTVRELGAPEGGEVGGNNNILLMALAFLAVFGIGCAAILMAPSISERWRALNRAEDEDRHRSDLEHDFATPAGPDAFIVPPYGGAAADPRPHRAREHDFASEHRDEFDSPSNGDVDPVSPRPTHTR